MDNEVHLVDAALQGENHGLVIGEAGAWQVRGRCSKLLLDVERVEVDDGRDEVFAHDHLTQRLPIEVTLTQQRANRLDRHLDGRGWIGKPPHLLQVLAFYRFYSYM